MTDGQRLKNRARAAKQRATLAAAIERFKEIATAVSGRHSDENYDTTTEYADPKTAGLALRETVYKHRRKGEKAAPELRWFFERPGRRALELHCRREETPREAREQVRLLLAGDEGAIMCTYLNNNQGIDANECLCFCPSVLLQEKTVKQLELDVEKARRILTLFAEKGVGVVRRNACHLVPVRCRLRHIEAMLKRYAKFRDREGLQIKVKAQPTREAA